MNYLMQRAIEEKRKMKDCLIRSTAIPDSVLEGVTGITDVPFDAPSLKDLKFDLFTPRGSTQPLPVTVVIHGGGFIAGNKAMDRHFCVSLCKQGFLVFAVEYGICPEQSLEEMLDNLLEEIGEISRDAALWGGIPGAVSLLGDGSGGYLAAAAGMILSNPGNLWPLACNIPEVFVPAVVTVSGQYRISGSRICGTKLEKLLRGPGKLPIPADLADAEDICNFPALLMIAGQLDPEIQENLDFYFRGSRKGYRISHRFFDANSDFYPGFSVRDPELPESVEIIEMICRHLKENQIWSCRKEERIP